MNGIFLLKEDDKFLKRGVIVYSRNKKHLFKHMKDYISYYKSRLELDIKVIRNRSKNELSSFISMISKDE